MSGAARQRRRVARQRAQTTPEIVRRFALGAVLAVSGLLGLRFMTASDGYPALLLQRHEFEGLRQEVVRLDRANSDLRERIRALKEDPHAVERIAREELDLVAPGEVLYLFPADLEAGDGTPRDPEKQP